VQITPVNNSPAFPKCEGSSSDDTFRAGEFNLVMAEVLAMLGLMPCVPVQSESGGEKAVPADGFTCGGACMTVEIPLLIEVMRTGAGEPLSGGEPAEVSAGAELTPKGNQANRAAAEVQICSSVVQPPVIQLPFLSYSTPAELQAYPEPGQPEEDMAARGMAQAVQSGAGEIIVPHSNVDSSPAVAVRPAGDIPESGTGPAEAKRPEELVPVSVGYTNSTHIQRATGETSNTVMVTAAEGPLAAGGEAAENSAGAELAPKGNQASRAAAETQAYVTSEPARPVTMQLPSTLGGSEAAEKIQAYIPEATQPVITPLPSLRHNTPAELQAYPEPGQPGGDVAVRGMAQAVQSGAGEITVPHSNVDSSPAVAVRPAGDMPESGRGPAEARRPEETAPVSVGYTNSAPSKRTAGEASDTVVRAAAIGPLAAEGLVSGEHKKVPGGATGIRQFFTAAGDTRVTGEKSGLVPDANEAVKSSDIDGVETVKPSGGTGFDHRGDSFLQSGLMQHNNIAPAGTGLAEDAGGVTLPGLKDRVAQEIRHALSAGKNEVKKEFQLKLEPEHLGRITVKLFVSNGELNVHFYTGNHTVKDVLEGSLPLLRESLIQQDLKLNEAFVFIGNGDQSGTGRGFEEKKGESVAFYGRHNNRGAEDVNVEHLKTVAKEPAYLRVDYLV